MEYCLGSASDIVEGKIYTLYSYVFAESLMAKLSKVCV